MSTVARNVASELLKESDRGCVVLAFAWMDEYLTLNLQNFLLPSEQKNLKTDELLGAGKALGDAGTKIDLSRRLGLLRKRTQKSLHIFRKLRNDFAHISSKINFQTEIVRNRINSLMEIEIDLLAPLLSHDQEEKKLHTIKDVRSKSSDKEIFVYLAGIIVASLVLINDTLTPISKIEE